MQQIQLTSKSFGGDILLTSPFAEQVIEMILEEKVAVVTTGVGNPEAYISQFRQARIKVIKPVRAIIEEMIAETEAILKTTEKRIIKGVS